MMTIEEALAVFELKQLPQSCLLLAKSVGTPARIAAWNNIHVQAYQLLFNTLLGRKKRKPASMEVVRKKRKPTPMPVRRVKDGKATA